MEFEEFCLLIEAKQDIINLGYPDVVAKLFYERFGNLAFLMSKWFKDYKCSGWIYENNPKDWWRLATQRLSETPSMYDLTYLYDATKDEESYRQACEKLELSRDETVDLDEQRKALEAQINSKFFSDGFFEHNDLIKDIIDGTIKDIAPYKKLTFSAAKDKYDKQKIFKDREPIKVYENGYKWIDAGKRCGLVGKLMKNCGSTGLMGWDVDRTLLTLFDARNKPHVVVTYSPNEKRISSDEGVGSSEVKSKYHDYILDLSKFLGVRFDYDKSKSTALKVKYLLGDFATNIETLPGGSIYDTYFKFLAKGQEYYTNGNMIVSAEDLKKVTLGISQGQIQLKNDQNNLVKNVFNYLNTSILAGHGVHYIPIQQFSK